MHTIEIDNDVMNYLKSKADPFSDTPNSVLRRSFGLDKPGAEKTTKTQMKETIQSDEFVKKIIKHHYRYDNIPERIGRYQYMFDLDGKLVYFQNFSKPTSNLWYRLKSDAIAVLKGKESEIIFTYSVDGNYYPIQVSD